MAGRRERRLARAPAAGRRGDPPGERGRLRHDRRAGPGRARRTSAPRGHGDPSPHRTSRRGPGHVHLGDDRAAQGRRDRLLRARSEHPRHRRRQRTTTAGPTGADTGPRAAAGVRPRRAHGRVPDLAHVLVAGQAGVAVPQVLRRAGRADRGREQDRRAAPDPVDGLRAGAGSCVGHAPRGQQRDRRHRAAARDHARRLRGPLRRTRAAQLRPDGVRRRHRVRTARRRRGRTAAPGQRRTRRSGRGGADRRHRRDGAPAGVHRGDPGPRRVGDVGLPRRRRSVECRHDGRLDRDR